MVALLPALVATAAWQVIWIEQPDLDDAATSAQSAVLQRLPLELGPVTVLRSTPGATPAEIYRDAAASADPGTVVLWLERVPELCLVALRPATGERNERAVDEQQGPEVLGELLVRLARLLVESPSPSPPPVSAPRPPAPSRLSAREPSPWLVGLLIMPGQHVAEGPATLDGGLAAFAELERLQLGAGLAWRGARTRRSQHLAVASWALPASLSMGLPTARLLSGVLVPSLGLEVAPTHLTVRVLPNGEGSERWAIASSAVLGLAYAVGLGGGFGLRVNAGLAVALVQPEVRVVGYPAGQEAPWGRLLGGVTLTADPGRVRDAIAGSFFEEPPVPSDS